jgi:hypothetical protein
VSARSDAPGQCPFLSVSVRVSGHFERSSEIQDFEKRRAAAARQATAAITSLCSHIRITIQPKSINRRPVSRSRDRFASILARHHWPLFFSQVSWIGQPCQKQPSTRGRFAVGGRQCRPSGGHPGATQRAVGTEARAGAGRSAARAPADCRPTCCFPDRLGGSVVITPT